jgi:hypothetical protein
MAWELLMADGWSLHGLLPLMKVVHDGDSVKLRPGSEAYQASRRDGLHALLAELRCSGIDYSTIYTRIAAWLDRYIDTYKCSVYQGPMSDQGLLADPYHRYARGMVYLRTLEANNDLDTFHEHVTERYYHRLALKRWDPDWKAAERLAVRWQMTVFEVRTAAQFAFSINTIVRQCGWRYLAPLIEGKLCETDKKIGTMSRFSPERKQLYLDELEAGRKWSSIRSDVPDTAGFFKMVSRLARGGGLVSKCLMDSEAGQWPPLGGDAGELNLYLAGMREDCERLKSLIATFPDDGVSERQAIKTGVYCRDQPQLSLPHVSAARAFLSKCLRDLPSLEADKWPTPDEKARSTALLSEWIETIERLSEVI